MLPEVVNEMLLAMTLLRTALIGLLRSVKAILMEMAEPMAKNLVILTVSGTRVVLSQLVLPVRIPVLLIRTLWQKTHLLWLAAAKTIILQRMR